MKDHGTDSLYLKLKDYLIDMGDIDTVEQRNDLLMSTGYGYLSSRINKQGSADEFVGSLLTVIGGEGQDTFIKFFSQLDKVRKLGTDAQKDLKGILDTLKNLSGHQWNVVVPLNSSALDNNAFWQVHQLLEQSKFDEAEQKLAKVTLSRNSAIFCYWKADIALKKGNIDAALAYTHAALEQDNFHLYSRALRIKLHLLKGSVNEAKTLVEESYGMTDELDTWLNCLTSHRFLFGGPWTNYELEAGCPFPTYQWRDR